MLSVTALVTPLALRESSSREGRDDTASEIDLDTAERLRDIEMA